MDMMLERSEGHRATASLLARTARYCEAYRMGRRPIGADLPRSGQGSASL
jgi:hypothetical protein